MKKNITESQKHSLFYLWLVCLGVGMSGLMFGLDSSVISGGIDLIKIQFNLNPEQEGWIVSSAMVGCVIGVIFGGWSSDKYGRKPSLILSGGLFLISLIGSMLAENASFLAEMRLVGGLGIGISSVVSPMYISESAPARIRGRMVSLYQLAIVSGILLAFCSNAVVNSLTENQGFFSHSEFFKKTFIVEKWRGMFGLCALPAFLNIACSFFLPESPRWLVKNGEEIAAQNVLNSLVGKCEAERQLTEIKQSIQETSQEISFLSLITSSSLRRPLLIGCFLSVFGSLCGINAIMYYSPKIFTSAGLGDNSAFIATVIIGVLNLLSTIGALLTVDHLGRRLLMLVGVSGVLLMLAAVGALFFFKVENPWWILLPLLGHVTFFAFSYGSCGWIIISEIFPTQVRGRASSVCLFLGWISGFLLAQTFPRMLTSFGGSGTFWIYGGCTLIALIFFWKSVPETKGKSLEEMDSFWVDNP